MNTTIENLRAEVAKTKIEPGTVVKFDRLIQPEFALKKVNQKRVSWDDDDDEDEEVDAKYPEVTGTRLLTYAALYVAGHWFLTGTQGLGTKKMKNREFIDLLGEPYISNVQVSTGWEAI